MKIITLLLALFLLITKNVYSQTDCLDPHNISFGKITFKSSVEEISEILGQPQDISGQILEGKTDTTFWKFKLSPAKINDLSESAFIVSEYNSKILSIMVVGSSTKDKINFCGFTVGDRIEKVVDKIGLPDELRTPYSNGFKTLHYNLNNIEINSTNGYISLIMVRNHHGFVKF